MLYQFDPVDAERFADHVDIRTIHRRDELHFRKCPYCQNLTDDRNTFAINLKTGQFKCLRATCGAKGNMITLARDFGFSLGSDFDEYYGNGKRYRNLRHYPRPETREPAIQYLESRGIPESITKKYSITTKEGQDNILCFPFYDENGILQFVKYRKTDFDKDRDKNKEWCLSNCKTILFGMNHCYSEKSTHLVITEGQIDSLSVAAAYEKVGINVVSVPTGAKGFTWVPHCWDFLGRFNTLTIFGDYENNKITLLDEMAARFHGTVLHVLPENYRDCKDANELLMKHGKEAVIKAIKEAVPIKSKRILDASEVERRSAVEGAISTGISQVDRLTGGFPSGRVFVITGQSGKGKSTLATQFAVRAVEQGAKVFCYSGELSEWEVAGFVDRQVAGSGYLETVENNLGFTEYRVVEEYRDAVVGWGRNRFFIFNNSIVDEGEEERSVLIKTVQTSIRQYGCDFIILDNLMTAMMDDVNLDLYRQQTRFVEALHNIAVKYGVVILLIAHQRKRQTNEFQNDDIAGSSNITNLVDVILNYSEPVAKDGLPDPKRDGDRILQIAKNRITGQTNMKGIKLWFDETSARISEKHGAFDWEMDWQSGVDGFVKVEKDDMEDIPF